MKNNALLLIVFLSSLSLYSQEINFDSLPKYDCSDKKWLSFSKDTIIVVTPNDPSYTIDGLKNYYAFFNDKYVIKTENELKNKDLDKSLFIIGKVSDYKNWKRFNVPIKKEKKGFNFNQINFLGKQDALWFNDDNRIVITANNKIALNTILDIGQFGMTYFALQNNQLTYFGNDTTDVYNIQNIKKSNYSFHNVESANFYISKGIKTKIDVIDLNKKMKEFESRYASFFDISIPKSKINILIHANQKEISCMMGMWQLSCGGSSEGMNVRGEIHCVGSKKGLIHHEVSHHIFNANISPEKLPILLLEGVVEVFANHEKPKLYRSRINSVRKNWSKFNFKELIKNGDSFYNSNSAINYQVSGIFVKYFMETYGLNSFKSLCNSDDKIMFIKTISQSSFSDFIKIFKLWIDNQKVTNI